MNKSTIATILGTATLGLIKSSGSKNNGVVIRDIDSLMEYANDPNKAHLVIQVHLSYKNLTSLPPEIYNLSHLEGLGLSNNNLTSLPPEIGNLGHLKRLDLSYTNLTSLPKEIGNLSHLKILDLRNNNLTSLPPEIGNLSHLEGLYLRRNNLTSLPKEIGNLSHLEWLHLEGNNIQMPSRNTIQYWMNNLKPDALQSIFENMKPHSQLRRF